jgi:hypothetical protein
VPNIFPYPKIFKLPGFGFVLAGIRANNSMQMMEYHQRGATLNIPGSFLSVGNQLEKNLNLNGNDNHKAADKLSNGWGKVYNH